ncbi:hypothetical protein [Acanthopleuribacter pedis]|uniref:Uncharacterized protein n=1 Tax=Acanthopleuribacter pedis TaxID=442870 RepID=A0A8J7U1K1_9BACT|nr:hypothetical protein [Acanthopleuribacter pedis]MBO1317612.1 hypothetical protein [Acanthopleuribacter pedis]
MGWFKKFAWFGRQKSPDPTPAPKPKKAPLTMTEEMMAAMLADGLSVAEIRAVYADMDEAAFQKSIRRVVKRLPNFF